jgi:hypothetical protein
MNRLVIAVAISLVVPLLPTAAHAFTECESNSGGDLSGHWPNPNNVANFGTQKWDFDWRISADFNAGEGIEVSNVRYASDLSQPKKLVLRRGSLPFLPVHYPDVAPECTGSPHHYPDRLFRSQLDPFCCAHVPTTVCYQPPRAMECSPLSQEITTCPAGAPMCSGMCEGTQVDTSPPVEDGVGEVVSGASDADVVFTATFKIGLYQFVQRWRFMDNGTILPSIRLGGIHDCQWHNHQVYFRLNFDLVDSGQSETVQQCADGTCGDLAAPGWSTAGGCGFRSTPTTSWRIEDAGAPGRAVIIASGATEGQSSTFCEDTSSVNDCGPGGCFNSHDFCALGTSEPHETFVTDACNDHLPDAPSTFTDSAFWYFAHVDHHDPCSYLPMCDPDLGTVAFGPTIRAVGY